MSTQLNNVHKTGHCFQKSPVLTSQAARPDTNVVSLAKQYKSNRSHKQVTKRFFSVIHSCTGYIAVVLHPCNNAGPTWIFSWTLIPPSLAPHPPNMPPLSLPPNTQCGCWSYLDFLHSLFQAVVPEAIVQPLSHQL